MSDKKTTKSQKNAMTKINKLAEINILDLGRDKVGISIMTNEECTINILFTALMNLLSDLKDCKEQNGEGATMEEFDEWQDIKRKN